MSNEVVIQETRKLKLLCLHGFRTSDHILKTQLKKWPKFVLDQLDLFFPDAPLPAIGKSLVEGLFDPPYYEWLNSKKHGPIDGLLGFSQGSVLSAALAGLQAKVTWINLKSHGTELLESFVDPVVIYHREGHIVPSLDEKGLSLM